MAPVAVRLLHSYADPAHEQRLKALLAEAVPGVPVSPSSGASPELRENERSSTTVPNALLMPVVRGHLDRLRARLGGAVRLDMATAGGRWRRASASRWACWWSGRRRAS